MNERTREMLEDLEVDLEALRSQLVMARRTADAPLAAQLIALDLQAARALARVHHFRRPKTTSWR
jgi:hypothetical protein